jgi:hypothetical protein
MEKEETKSIELSDLYAKAQDDLKLNADKAWESIKLCITLSSLLITVVLGLLEAITYFSTNFPVKIVLIFALVPFPILMIKTVDFLSKNFKRECRRMYENITILMKIEDELPQRRDLGDTGNFNKEKEYFPDEWKKIKFLDTKEYVDTMMQRKDKFYSNMKPLFSVLYACSYVLLSAICIIAVIVIVLAL